MLFTHKLHMGERGRPDFGRPPSPKHGPNTDVRADSHVTSGRPDATTTPSAIKASSTFAGLRLQLAGTAVHSAVVGPFFSPSGATRDPY